MGAILWWAIMALMVLWLVGLALNVAGGLIHVLLATAVVLLLVTLYAPRQRV